MNTSAKITVFYDGMCGLCAREINYYKRIAKDGLFIWHDIASDAQPFTAKGYRKTEGLKALHVEDTNGVMHIGVDAFIIIWKQLTGWKILAFIVSIPVIRHIANYGYKCFANWRFKRLSHCQLALSEESTE